MPRKDPKKCRYKNFNTDLEYMRQWKKEHPNYDRERYIKKNPIPMHTYHDFETHRELAMSSGIRTHREWRECCKMGLIPNGIYSSPDRVFRRK